MFDDGYTDLPPGKIAAVVTYLELFAAPPSRTTPADGWSLAPIGGDLARYRGLFREVGEAWLWSSRVLTGDAELQAILDDPGVEALALRRDGADIGLLELDFRGAGECEIAFLGVAPRAIGTGAGRFLMDAAIGRAFARPITRLWLHTCTLDHPGAVAFYLRSGFRPYKRAIEVLDDPRLTGHMPREAAPHAPMI
ncbi:MAG: Histone acetyltransferase HPA2 and related acetyltransferases [uncultured Microvirga sp.]|uniref:Histone acetyltransferase HPA2 and related acetyltransferases n=1 Tax=uncultured Microvirga sp. TaxID=412392 RepID=A0A6J4LTS6_9HYPH|nr:MAG: Histone acetyltransferase HPA2 and related acetyltransferases [uncultured Microvirga sp.]